MSNLSEFIYYLEKQIGQPYLWGGQHTELTPENYKTVIQRSEKNTGGYKDGSSYEKCVIDFCDREFAKGKDRLYAYDCSGLGMWWLQNFKKLYKHDMSAHNMMGTCDIRMEVSPKKGWWVFHLSEDSSRANHIGYMINDKYLVEAKGRKYGVVKTRFSKKDWDKWGIPSIFKSQILEEKDSKDTSEQSEFVFKRFLKYGSRGEDVKKLKQLLYENGYKTLTLTNPNYRTKTVEVVKEYQKTKGLKIDGIAGPETIISLGGIYI